MCLLTLWAKEEKREVFCCSLPCFWLSFVWLSCLAEYLSPTYLSRLRSGLSCDKIFELVLSQKIWDLFQSLCLQITSAGQLCGFSVGRRTVFGFVFVALDLLYVSGHNGCLTLIKSSAHWGKDRSQCSHETTVNFYPGLSVLSQRSICSLLLGLSPHIPLVIYTSCYTKCVFGA